ncbi:sugar phosphate nucleotidyltransferase [Candidatus Pelagibacter communis]|uniref:sugar phosphate nucleotidyltransferase n=1 Tax=Pelagibacter ubique TaxID=198252 RepID=UPI00094D02A7|nr:sugar phosphate nucleotidyltransferase [Candidatus Pelagibacter ubique]
MKIRPVILCGGAGTRLWPNSKNHQAKQFIDFGNWTLLGKTLERTKASIYDTPIISTNKKYLSKVKQHLRKNKINKYKIVVEPAKRNTAPAILSTALIKDIPDNQPLMFFTADHLIEKMNIFNKAINKNKSNLNENNIFVFGIKPKSPTSDYGYFLTKKIKGNINKVTRFIEKPKEAKAKEIIRKNGYWNSGMFYLRKDSIINNFKKYSPTIYRNCVTSVNKAKYKSNTYHLNKSSFIKATAKSFDYAILEKTKEINAIKLDIPWSDLGSWKEILKMYEKNKNNYIKKKNVYYRPWGRYTNLFEGKEFLIKELYVKPKGILSLQKHHHRAEHWLVTQGNAKITLNKETIIKKPGEHIFIPLEAIHRVQNPGQKPVKIMEAQVGSILKETDIVRFQDLYGRVSKK